MAREALRALHGSTGKRGRPIITLQIAAKGVEQNTISTFFIDSRERLWVAYRPGTLSYYEPDTDRFIAALPGLSLFITHINELADGRLLLVTRNHGIYFYDPGSNELTNISTLDYQTRGIVTNRFQHSFFDRQGRLWLGSFDAGLMLFDVERETVTEHYTHDAEDPQSISSNLIISMQQTSNDGIWIGLNGRLVIFRFHHQNIYQHYSGRRSA